MAHNNEKKIERAVRHAQWLREQEAKAEALPIVERFNSKLEAGREPFFMPTIRAALITGHHWMIVVCRSCDTVIDLDLRVKRRPPEATVLMALMQQKYKSRIVMGEKDWTLVEESVHRFPNGKPTRDMIAKDGETITLGDASVTLVSTPGHTPDTYSFIFQVKDNGKPLTVAYNGGTAFNFVNDVPHFDIYIASQRKMGKAAADAGATVLLTNHSEFDNAVSKIRMMAARKEGEPSPFEFGARAVTRYFKVTEECAQAARLKLVNAGKS